MKKSYFIIFSLALLLLISCTGCDGQLDQNVYGDWKVSKVENEFFNDYSSCNAKFTSVGTNELELIANSSIVNSIITKIEVKDKAMMANICNKDYIIYITSDEKYYYLNLEYDSKVDIIYKREIPINEQKH